MSITISGDGDINATGNDIELNSTGTTDVTLAVGGGNVGIGTASPYTQLEISSADPIVRFNDSNGGTDTKNFELRYVGTSSPDIDGLYFRTVNDANTVYSDKMVLDGSGNLLVGKTTTAFGTAGVRLANTENYFTVDSSATADFNRLTNDGDIVKFYKDGSTAGSIGATSGTARLYIESSGGANLAGVEFSVSGTSMSPRKNSASSDNEVDVGSATYRWDDVYATNGTIQTSDANEKQDVAELDEAEKRVATAAKGLIRKFRWISSVEEKGDDARIHVGIIAQDLKAAFEAEGLDPGRYAMFISSTWWEADETYTDDEGVEQIRTNTYETAEEAPEGAVERTRLGVRYNQLLAFIIGAL
jgi:hypothetical protein